ncbi:MAG: hypothetical protein FWG55_05795 [Candidatus Bathyarchaeota archaeon]|nr:hypothetical protein [Candidatus Termiticorpusculum sp.]
MDAWLRGSSVDHSVEYEKFIRDPSVGGIIESMAVNYKHRTYYLFSDGRLFTRQATDDMKQETYSIYEIMEKLYGVGAVQF